MLLGLAGCADDSGPTDAAETEAGSGTDDATGGSGNADDTEGAEAADETADAESDDDGGAPGLDAARELFEPIVAAQCEHVFSCCTEGELLTRLGPATADVQECTARTLDMLATGTYAPVFEVSGYYFGNLVPLLAYGIPLDRVQPNDEGFAACAAELAARPCAPAPTAGEGGSCVTPPVTTMAACDNENLFTGMQDVGDECSLSNSIECVAGTRCQVFGGNVGACVQTLGEGGACISDYECVAGMICDYMSNTCVQPAEAGQACAYSDPDAPQIGTEQVRCAAGLTCDPISETCGSSQCAFGSQCGEQDALCPADLSCVQGECGFLRAPGESCWQDDDCADGRCTYVQSLGSVCQVLAPVGAPCGDHEQCATAYCEAQSNTCAQPVAIGETCDPGLAIQQCDAGYCELDTCIAFAPLGGSCVAEQCNWPQGHDCNNDVCVQYPYPDGSSCNDDNNCSSGNCDGTCVAALEPGAECILGGGRCVEGSFCDADGTQTGVCRARLGEGEACDGEGQCWGYCDVVFGQQRCRGTAPGTLVCDGA